MRASRSWPGRAHRAHHMPIRPPFVTPPPPCSASIPSPSATGARSSSSRHRPPSTAARRSGSSAPNGAGKTTLFRLLTREEEPDDGQVSVDRGVTVGYFSQDIGEMKGKTVVEATLDGAGPVSDDRRARCTNSNTRSPIRRAPTRWSAPGRSLRRSAGALRRTRRLQPRGPRARSAGRNSASPPSRWTATSVRCRAAGRCASVSRASW